MKIFYSSLLFVSLLQSCGQNCNFVSRLANEPVCRDLRLNAQRTVKPFNTACGAVSNSRKISLACPKTTGLSGECTSLANGFPVYSVLLANNNGGSFKDGNGVVYNNCNDVFAALAAVPAALQNIAGYYVSDNSTPAETLACTDAGGCILNSGSCYAAWDTVSRVPTGTASLAPGTIYLTCTYIDNAALISAPAPAAVGKWSLPLVPVSATGSSPMTFGISAGWTDAF